jgi:hypothetical protein
MPSWLPYMVACCLAAGLLGWIVAWMLDEWKNR